ncbi:MAG: hypothetical protein KH015_16030 [Gordonibacter pamelaeae]|uniref:DUF3574 domain-containing protein n=2 Tax=Gordonibacter pamelaeae TaxID=471189 RepID=D6E724_9ACTN|nr:hypothetical protein [Gordonibacter pamelaeae]HJH75199.1 hypothetical protein [Eggerthellaceae bacterium]MBS4897252.1 hypothetical protein [Gordonibacter pamelaeae]MCB6312010.1 hypothetical protein [Gordonibacter pamelaeae]RDB63585.1 hypothetical protein C1877_12040 [Gordonibacter pamelaeae]CBL03521.1 hypothetical protein GPA_06020 [Gordonibacter pamelaeae 7-10-1-b]
MNAKARAGLLATVLAVVAFGGGVLAGCTTSEPSGGSGIGLVNKVTTQEGVAFTLYVGLADADTGAQELSFDEAKALATPLVSATGEGYTVIEAQGGYTDDAGNLVENGTLVYTGIHAGEQEVLGLVDDLKAALHVESVYVTSAQQGYAIYGGTIAFAA